MPRKHLDGGKTKEVIVFSTPLPPQPSHTLHTIGTSSSISFGLINQHSSKKKTLDPEAIQTTLSA
jgi:hypothetical protein